MTPRRIAAQVAANERWAHTQDRSAATAPARAGFMKKFEEMVDPEGLLDESERAAQAANALRAHMARLRAASARKRTQVRRSSGVGDSK